MKVSNVQGIPFRLLNWDDLASLTNSLVEQINGQAQELDRLVALANGGLTMVRHLADMLEMDRISLLQIKSYTGINENVSQPRIEQPLHINVENEHLLVFEDIVDTGNTLRSIQQYLSEKQAASYTVATLVQKSHATMKADFVGAEWDEWIIFPYETRETIQALKGKWSAEQVSVSSIRENLQEIGFTNDQIDRFW
jgi:hypoxanthine phosphoribosyltransferase